MGLISSMRKSITNGVGVHLGFARKEGIIPWEWIVDDTRNVEGNQGWNNKEAFKQAALNSFRLSRWTQQSVRIEVWSEKSTVKGTLLPMLDKYGIQFRPMRGFDSHTDLHDVVVMQKQRNGIPLIALHVGDWDCSGRRMIEVDVPTRLAKFWKIEKVPFPFNIKIIPVALTKKDCRSLPSFPAKRTDTRFAWFVKRYGYKCWELDAMSPAKLRLRVEGAIRLQPIDWQAWERCERAEQAEQESLETFLSAWQKIVA
jgi:hypothetical protein